MSINRVEISGHLTRDPELKSTQGGTTLLSFGMAVNERRQNAQGEWEDYPNFVDVVLFGSRADWMARDLHKGKLVHVAGRLRYSSWEKDGERRSKLSVVADEIDYERPPRQKQPTGTVGTSQRPAPAPPTTDGVYDEEIPF